MRNARSAHMQIRAIRLNLPKVSIYQKPIVKMQTKTERECVEKWAHKMGKMKQSKWWSRSLASIRYPKERSISMASAASPIHSWVNCSGSRTSNKSTHSNLLFVCSFFFVFAPRFGLAHFAFRIYINVYAERVRVTWSKRLLTHLKRIRWPAKWEHIKSQHRNELNSWCVCLFFVLCLTVQLLLLLLFSVFSNSCCDWKSNGTRNSNHAVTIFLRARNILKQSHRFTIANVAM